MVKVNGDKAKRKKRKAEQAEQPEMSWVSIHGHTNFSFADGYGTVEEHVKRVKELGMKALGITEHGNLSSHVQLEQECNKAGIKPIFGIEAYCAPPKTQAKFHQTILAMDEDGYRNLNRMVTRSWEADNNYYKPTVTSDLLEEYGEGLIITSGCASSLLSCTLLGGKWMGDERLDYTDEDYEKCLDVIEWYQDVFGDRYYLEVQRLQDLDRTCALNVAFEQLSKDTGVPLVSTADVHYPFEDDREVQAVLHAVGRGSTYKEQWESGFYDIPLTYPESDWEVFDNMVATGLSEEAAAEACRNTARIADRCNVVLPKNEPIKFPYKDYGYKSIEDLIWDKIEEGIEFRKEKTQNQRLIDNEQEYRDRVGYEMERIVPRGFCDYFMMLSDAVVFAKENKIAVGPGRGSAAASLVCYLLRITEVDPLQFPTMWFERFIDPKRLDLPDVDLDFDDRRRYEVVEHLRRRWGHDHVGNIGNFVKYRGKNSINDVCKVARIPQFAGETVNDLIIERSGGDSRAADSLQDTFDMFPKAAEMLEKFPNLKFAPKLEGNVKGLGIHAAGIVISNTPITETCAIYSKKKSNGDAAEVIPYDKKDAEYLGMLKADFLGLSTMGIIGRTLDLIGMDLEELYRVPLDDPDTMEAFHKADVFGIFQFEGRATRLVCRDVAPDNFMELADINALSRPGPLFSGMTAQYINIKHGKQEPESLHPIVDEYTAISKGQIVYQEQVLGIIRDLGGFPVQRVGDIRKIISQKLGEASFNEMFEEFARGAKKLHDVDEDLAARIWKFMVTSATYSFCVTGDTELEKAGKGKHATGLLDEFITVEELYELQNSTTNRPMRDKIRSGRLKILGMDDDGRIRPNNLIKIHDPVEYRCTKITTDTGRTVTVSNDHRMLTMTGYKHTMELEVGDEVLIGGTLEDREAERHEDAAAKRGQHIAAAQAFGGGHDTLFKATKAAVIERSGNSCEHCRVEGDDRPWMGKHFLEFAHVMPLVDFDGDFTKYHAESNLLHLCNSCHKTFDYRMNGTRKKRWSRGRPTKAEMITAIEDAGEQLIYDVSMAGPQHNYLGNGFVHHNNSAHSISYSLLAFWSMWLKVHYPAEFYAAALPRLEGKQNHSKLVKLIRDASRRNVPILPPDLVESQMSWSVVDEWPKCVRAGWLEIPGIGPTTAKAINDKCDELGGFDSWDDLGQIKGIGPKTIDKIKAFCESDDPFGVGEDGRVLDLYRQAFLSGNSPSGVPHPTHTSDTFPSFETSAGEQIVWMGFVHKREYKDIIEDERARSGDSLEEIKARVKDPELAKSCVLACHDDGDEDVYLRVSRWRFPDLAETLEGIDLERDMVIAVGKRQAGFGITMAVRELIVIDASED